jgi:hypothetical protein
MVPAVLLGRDQILQVSGIGQFVKNSHRSLLFGQPMQHEIGTDKASSARHQYGKIQ